MFPVLHMSTNDHQVQGVLILGLQINFDQEMNSQIWKPQIIRINCTSVKNKLTVTGGDVGGYHGGKGRRVFRNNYKGHMDKTKKGWKQGREVGLARVGREWWWVNADNCN